MDLIGEAAVLHRICTDEGQIQVVLYQTVAATLGPRQGDTPLPPKYDSLNLHMAVVRRIFVLSDLQQRRGFPPTTLHPNGQHFFKVITITILRSIMCSHHFDKLALIASLPHRDRYGSEIRAGFGLAERLCQCEQSPVRARHRSDPGNS